MIFKLFTVFALLLPSVASSQSQDTRILNERYEFEEGATEMLYGDNVVLRKKPSIDSRALDTLAIMEEVKIVKQTEEISEINGLDSYWYKVKHGARTGYILGGLIAMDHALIGEDTYLVIMSGLADQRYVRTRVVSAAKEFYGHETQLNTYTFYIEGFHNRGVKGIENMLAINLYADACGVDDGLTYLFNDGAQLIEAISLSSVSDAGAFWFVESLIFPEDEGGYDDIVFYEREFGEPKDEELNWSRSIVHNITLRWEDGEFSPNVDELDFQEP